MEEGKRLHWSAMLVQAQRLVWTLLFVGFGMRETGAQGALVGMAFLFVMFIVVRWRRFKYTLKEDGVYAIAGGLFKTETHIPYSQIQTVDSSATFVHRLLKVTRLQIKTASKGTQLDLMSINVDEATRVRRVIEQKRSLADSPDGIETAIEAPVLNRRQLTTTEIMVAAASSKQFFVSLGIVSYLYGQISEVYALNFVDNAIEAAQTEQGFDWTLLDPTFVLVLGAITFVAWVGTVLYTVLVYKSFGIGRTAKDISIRRGFFNIHEVAVPVKRVQAVEIKQTPLQLLLGYGELQIRVIGHTEQKGKNTVLHPCIAKSEWQSFLDEFVPGFQLAEEKFHAPIRALPRFVMRSAGKVFFAAFLATLAVVTVMSWWGAFAVSVIGLPILAVGGVIGFINLRIESIGYRERCATFILQGWNRKIGVVRRDAFQQHIVIQSWIQRRLRLATFGVEIASGAVGVTHFAHDFDQEEAQRFARWLSA